MTTFPRRFWAGAVPAGLALAILAATVASRWIGVGVLRPWGMAEFAGGRVSLNLAPQDPTDPDSSRSRWRTGLWPLAWTVETQPRYLTLHVMYDGTTRGLPRMDPPDPGPRQTHWSALGVFFTQTTPQGRDFEFTVWPLAAGLLAIGGPLLRSGWILHRRLLRGRCHACGYETRSLPAGSPCPECGAARGQAG